VGNPPWVNWEYLPPEYREISAGVWEKYGLIGPVPGKRRQSSDRAKTDVSILMLYVAADKYAVENGRLSFVLPGTIFQSELGGWHFRKFELPGRIGLSVEVVDDLDSIKPFRSQAANVASVATFVRDKKTRYPVKWREWRRGVGTILDSSSLGEVMACTEITEVQARPIEPRLPQSPWVVGDAAGLAALRKLTGPSFYSGRAREGINTRGANGVFFVDAWLQDSRLFVRNRPQDGRLRNLAEVEQCIEPEYVFPLLRGENVSRFRASPEQFVVLPHDPVDPVEPVKFERLPRGTREFLARHREILEGRRKFRNFNPEEGDWHGLYSVLSATFTKQKVVWREMANGVIAAAIGESLVPGDGASTIIPDHKLFIVPCDSMEEADFVSGFLNSEIANFIVRSYAISTGVSAHILKRVPIPRFIAHDSRHATVSSVAKKIRLSGQSLQTHGADLEQLNEQVMYVLGVDLIPFTTHSGKAGCDGRMNILGV
jgi:hypothetical protein